MVYTRHGLSAGSEFKCLNCDKQQIRTRNFQKYCSQKCQLEYEYKTGKRNKNKIIEKAQAAVREKSLKRFKENPNRWIGKRGYWIIYVPLRGQVYEHQYIWEQANGQIPKGKAIHHINFDKLDNRLENLQILDKKEHHKLHYAKLIIDKYGQFTPNK